jgi:ADP-ribosyl-[dinitrogen reductase] hydrolase
MSSLSRFERTGDHYPGDQDPDGAGNGALMRLAPIPLAFSGLPVDAHILSARSSRVTHGAEQSVDACRYLTGLIIGALKGATKEELTSGGAFAPDPDYAGISHPEIAAVAAGSFREKSPPEINGGGYVVPTLEAALWAFHNFDDFESGALAVVNLGDDADTTGAVYGQLAGAYFGVDGIPDRWLEKLVMREKIEELADGLLVLSERLAA